MNASKVRREGRLAYCPDDNPETECPYKATYARKCWIEGFEEEREFIAKVESEEQSWMESE